jgi:uncharacterized protein (TIGR03067 family)
MPRSIPLLFVLVSLPLAVARADEDAAKKALAEWKGHWQLVSITQGEMPLEFEAEKFVCFARDDKFLYGGQPFVTFSVQPESSPKGVDLKFQGMTESKDGIYAIEGDTLKICLNWDDAGIKERPADFTVKDHPTWRLMEFRRVKDLKEGDEPPARGFVGIALKTEQDQEGITIFDIVPDSPAKKAGVEPGDILMQLDGVKATDLTSTVDRCRRAKAGSEMRLQVLRKGESKELKVKVGVFPIHLFFG